MSELPREKCLEFMQGACRGPVEYRTTPDREDGWAFPRCEAHFEARLVESERVLELRSQVPPSWFDPA
jgi:hypothetical protein